MDKWLEKRIRTGGSEFLSHHQVRRLQQPMCEFVILTHFLFTCLLVLDVASQIRRKQSSKSISRELESNLSLKVCRLNVAFVCLCREAPRLLWLSICCLSASLSLCQPINLRALTVTCLSLCQERIFSLFRRRNKHCIMWWTKLNTTGPNHFHSFLSVLLSLPQKVHRKISVRPFLLLGILFFPWWCFRVHLLFPLLPVTSFTLWPGCAENGSIPPSTGWRSGK